MSNKLLPSEALYGFAAWLTTRRGTLELGECHDAAEICELLNEFCIWNDLEPIRDETWPNFSMPPRLWFRYTPCLAKIEWAVRKVIHDLCKS